VVKVLAYFEIGVPAVNVTQFGGTPGTFAAGVPEVKVASIANNAITAVSIAADAITDAKVASDVTIASVTGAVGSVTGNVGGNVTGSVGSVAGNVGGNVVGSVTSVSGNVGGSVASVVGNVGGNVTGSVGSVAAGGITAASLAADCITAAKIADGAIDSATFAAGTTIPRCTLVDTATTVTNQLAAATIATAVLATQMTESYASNGTAPTLAQAAFAIHQMLMNFVISGTSLTVKKLNNSTTAFVVTLDDATSPTGAART
jgi:hypothetical protein